MLYGGEKDWPHQKAIRTVMQKEKREDTLRTVYFILKIQVFVLCGGVGSVIRRGGYRRIIALCTYIIRAGSVALTRIDDDISVWVVEAGTRDVRRGMRNEKWGL